MSGSRPKERKTSYVLTIVHMCPAQLVEAMRYKPEGRGFDGVTGNDNPSGRNMALGSTQPLTKMSTRNIS